MYIDPYPHTNKGKDTHTQRRQHIHMRIPHVTRATSQLLYLLNYHVEQAEPWLCPHHHYQGPCSNPRKRIQWAVIMTTVCHTWDCPGSLRAPQNRSFLELTAEEVREDGHRSDSAHCCWLWRWRRSHARSRERTLRAESMTANCKELNSAKHLSECETLQSLQRTAWLHQDLDFSPENLSKASRTVR